VVLSEIIRINVKTHHCHKWYRKTRILVSRR